MFHLLILIINRLVPDIHQGDDIIFHITEGVHASCDSTTNFRVGEHDVIPNISGSRNSPGIVFLIFREEEVDMTPDTPSEGGHTGGIHPSVKEGVFRRWRDDFSHNSGNRL